MGLLVILGADGKKHLIHSGQIGPQKPPPKSTGAWPAVWKRFEGQK